MVFVGETRENAEKGALQEAWRRVVQKNLNKPYLLERLEKELENHIEGG